MPTWFRPPRYVKRFRDVLCTVAPKSFELPIARPPIQGHRGILHTSRIQYNDDAINLLGRQHEYTFLVDGKRIEISMQLYLNVTDHWRLFCLCAAGLLLSVNLSLLRRQGDSFAVTQRLRISERGTSAKSREHRTAQLCATLTRLGLEIDSDKRLVLGTFDTETGRFLDTTPQTFIRDFALAALVKGHFMGNKAYRLPGLPSVSTVWTTVRRSGSITRAVPLGLRFEVLEAARGQCAKCGYGLRDGVRLHVDHKIPFSRGGRTERANLQALCEKCNLGKSDRPVRI
jgi:hypothetical protein